jgi:cell division septation protein DedD
VKKVDLREKSSAFVIGRGLIIAVILFTSTISFIIGYFVGKSTLKEGPAIRSLQENSKDMSALPLNVTSQQKDQPQDIAPSEEGRTQKTTGEISTEAVKNTQQLQKSPKIVYTVQVGAFKDAPEAESLKVRLDKKGFKAYVIPSESKREGRLYKVQVGEFATKKEAEILSLKIKKTVGLQAFVTFKKEEIIRQQ